MKNIAIITGASSGIGKEFLLNMPKNIEVDDKLVSYRRAGSEETITVSLDEFIELLNNDILNKVRYDK